MFPLEKEFGLEEIKQKCEESNSRIYGFIMYTRRHSYIVKTLRDKDFWNELNEISGVNWPIFAVQPLEEGWYTYPNLNNEEVLQFMIPTWHEPNENRKYLEVFSLQESKDLPCFIAFIWNDKNEIEQITFKLSNKNEQEAFDSIREVVTIISQTENNIHIDYKRSEQVFQNVKADIEAFSFRKKLNKSFIYFNYLKEFFKSI